MKQSHRSSMGRDTSSGQVPERLKPVSPRVARHQYPLRGAEKLPPDQQQGRHRSWPGWWQGRVPGGSQSPGHPQAKATGHPVAVWCWAQEG